MGFLQSIFLSEIQYQLNYIVFCHGSSNMKTNTQCPKDIAMVHCTDLKLGKSYLDRIFGNFVIMEREYKKCYHHFWVPPQISLKVPSGFFNSRGRYICESKYHSKSKFLATHNFSSENSAWNFGSFFRLKILTQKYFSLEFQLIF